MNDKFLIHRKYSRGRLCVFLLLLFTISLMTIGYSSNISSILKSIGNVTLNTSGGTIEITDINMTASSGVNSNNSSFYISSDSTNTNSILVSEFNVDFYRKKGNIAFSITYQVTIKNNSSTSKILESVDSTPTFGTNSATFNYNMSGISTGTSIVPGESVVVTLVFTLQGAKNKTTYSVNEVFKFNFADSGSSTFSLNSRLVNESDTSVMALGTSILEFNTITDKLPISISVENNSIYNATYTLSLDNSNFELVDKNGNSLEIFSINASSNSTLDLYLKISNNHVFENRRNLVTISLDTTSPSILDYDVGSISVVVPEMGSYTIISNDTLRDDSNIDFISGNSTPGLYKNIVENESTYFYYGNVTNNYVSFAGFTWRIIKIDKYGVKVILDSIIDTQSSWGNNPEVGASINSIIDVLNYENSFVKPIVDNWYKANLSTYSSVIKPSLFCLDDNYQTVSSSDNEDKIYYFGSYIRIGKETNEYTPKFNCNSEYTKEYNIGLISGDEVAFAGGIFSTNNKNYYLYNSLISNKWWTLSPSYFDSSVGKVEMMIVDGSFGKLDSININESIGIRPVITLDSDKLSGGDGSINNKYTFS